MTVKELLDVMSDQKEIFIKPNGRRMYFDGIAEDVPEELYDAVVTEIAPQVHRDDGYNAIRKYYGGMGVWVNPIPVWDAIADSKAATQKELLPLKKRLMKYGLTKEAAVRFAADAKNKGLLEDYTVDELMAKLERERDTEQSRDPFYSDENIRHLERVLRDVADGVAHFEEHELIEEG